MLKALLHRKLQRGIVEHNDDAETDDTLHVEPTRREDPLTASVFERLAYLPPGLFWDVLQKATTRLGEGGPALLADAPSGAPTWSFWPSLRPGSDGHNAVRVEPDVIADWGDTLLVFEAKHRSDQSATQWVEQIRAVRAMPEHSGKRIWLIAVGGIVAHEQKTQVAYVRQALSKASPGLLAMRWEDLHRVIDELRFSSRAPEQSAVLNDIAAALDAWGYRKKTWFSSLRRIGPSFQAEKSISVIQTWSVR